MSDKEEAKKEGEQGAQQGDEQQQQQQAEPQVEVIEKDEDEKELEKLERGDPEMIKICNIIMLQLEDFKVSINNRDSIK
jgi:hypothetical protein